MERPSVDEGLGRKWLDAQALGRLTRQFLQARLPMDGGVSGHHKSPHRGSSVEFAEYRKYAVGDDIRRLDWRVFGRTDRFYIREFEADTNLRCHLMLDASASMAFGAPSKFDYARKLIAHLAYLIVQQGDAVGLQCFGEKTRIEVPPRRNPAHLRHIFDSLDRVEPRGETNLLRGLHDAAEKIPRRALVMIFSDCFCDPEELLNCFQHLRFRKHDLVVFHLLDRRELEFRFDRPIRFVDLETPDQILAEPAVIRTQYLNQVEEYLKRLRHGCNQFYADYRQVVTDTDFEKVLADFLVEREQLRATGAK